jgi:anaerobic carbon-monoxide dehydrogenase iron sulfur subunit
MILISLHDSVMVDPHPGGIGAMRSPIIPCRSSGTSDSWEPQGAGLVPSIHWRIIAFTSTLDSENPQAKGHSMRLLQVKDDLCTSCMRCAEVCSETWFGQADPERAALAVGPGAASGSYAITVCTQCGDCIDICPTKAISRRPNGVVGVDKKLCVGCLACVGFCGIWAMRTHPDEFNPFKCVACGKCVPACPEGVLSIGEAATPTRSETEQWAERVQA